MSNDELRREVERAEQILSKLTKWVNRHNDSLHPGTRDNCEHCQEIIRIYGEMPPKQDLLNYAHPKDKQVYTKAVIPESLRWEVFERDNFTCAKCGSRRNLTADHIIPESNGGETSASNLQTLCRSCNSKKGAR